MYLDLRSNFGEQKISVAGTLVSAKLPQMQKGNAPQRQIALPGAVPFGKADLPTSATVLVKIREFD